MGGAEYLLTRGSGYIVVGHLIKKNLGRKKKRVNFENGGKENSEKETFLKKIRPNGVDFLNPEVQKPLTSIFEPNRSNFFFRGKSEKIIYFVMFFISF